MKCHLPIIFFIFFIISLGSYADETASSLKVYWNKMLPNTPMPKAITDSLHPELMDNKVTFATARKGAVGVDRAGDDNGNKFYALAATETQLHGDHTVEPFFLKEDLKPGTKKTLHFPPKSEQAAFLPRHVADSIPFSTAEFPTILKRFAVEPNSEEASAMKQTIKECEKTDGVVLGEEKYCPTSLESMVDFAVSRLGAGRSVAAVSTDAKSDDGKKKEFVVTGVKEVSKGSGEVVACHKGSYPYAVFYCHKIKRTEAYTVELKAEGREVVEAVAVCHKDTSAWNPKNLAFQVLKVKPGIPVCHLLTQDNLIWVRN